MATGLFAILDDVAVLLDDAAVMSKVAAKKTAGLLGDDLAVNAEKATGFHASRELPVIWAITKGSFVNKLIILPFAFLFSIYLPWLIVPILLVGGVYLSYEGAEKVYEWFAGHEHHTLPAQELDDPKEIVGREKSKIKAAIRTDFILSIEIVVITLETVFEQSFAIQFIVVSLIAVLATIGVYGLVALLVRMDDAGLHLIELSENHKGLIAKILSKKGHFLVAALPYAIRILGVVGTIAMLLVGGGMFVHNIDDVHHLVQSFPTMLGEFAVGLVVGFCLLIPVKFIANFRSGKS